MKSLSALSGRELLMLYIGIDLPAARLIRSAELVMMSHPLIDWLAGWLVMMAHYASLCCVCVSVSVGLTLFGLAGHLSAPARLLGRAGHMTQTRTAHTTAIHLARMAPPLPTALLASESDSSSCCCCCCCNNRRALPTLVAPAARLAAATASPATLHWSGAPDAHNGGPGRPRLGSHQRRP